MGMRHAFFSQNMATMTLKFTAVVEDGTDLAGIMRDIRASGLEVDKAPCMHDLSSWYVQKLPTISRYVTKRCKKMHKKRPTLKGPYNFHGAISKSIIVFVTISLCQLFYLTVLTIFNWYHFFIWLVLFCTGLFGIKILGLILRGREIIFFSNKVYIVLWLICGVSLLYTSRIDYIFSTLNFGLAATRSSDVVGGGGWSSVINAMFFPLGMLAVFYEKGFSRSFVISTTIVIAVLDILFMGTRNGPFFVFLYFYIFNDRASLTRLKVFSWLFVVVLFFEYTTRVRSGHDGDVLSYWYWKATESEVSGGSILNFYVYDFAEVFIPILLPFFYLIAYISHSVPDFFIFLVEYDAFFEPTFLHLRDQVALYTFSERSDLQADMATLRVRSGFYQTAYTSLLIDFGFILPIMAIIFVTLSRVVFITPIVILTLIFACLSNIENFFFQGLKPIHHLYYFIFFSIFVRVSRKRLIGSLDGVDAPS
jgi:hypothetical protein